ncbi:hypothetical protein AKJ09_02994 [Labilithrix luteola]|uniref:Uncharacterized protein n=1 Tax=Labilithrix luteola TaxID=1391654 RepID=A0A0K1PS18_9BACT|nr:hypothetical protein AKJ09_02994 [Labilithrix luteola]
MHRGSELTSSLDRRAPPTKHGHSRSAKSRARGTTTASVSSSP